MDDKHLKREKIFTIASNRMLASFSSFYIWKWFEEARNINHLGKDVAEKNVEIMSKYQHFFTPVFLACYRSFIVNTSIFFDSEQYEHNFSLGKLIKTLEMKIPTEDFILLKNKIEEIKSKNGKTISFIINQRNSDAVHQKLFVTQEKIVFKDIEILFDGIQEIFNIITKKYDDSITMWTHVEEDVHHSLNWMFENLERGEKSRLEEIYKEADLGFRNNLN